jgi:putative DNA primase/helicase
VADRLLSPRGEALTDLGLAEHFVARCSERIRYVRAWRTWLVWDERRWVRDTSGAVERLLKDVLRARITAAADLTDEREREALIHHVLASGTASRLQSVLELAATEAAVATVPERFDADPWRLNLLNGSLDLQIGTLQPHDAELYETKLAPVAYDPDAACPRWERFIADVTRGDTEHGRYLQRIAGYCLTGNVGEQAWFLACGPGANGKTTFVEVLRGLLGDYARAASFATFLVRGHETIREDIARLAGARLVTALEPPEGQRFNESLLKTLTGNDVVTARELYRGSQEFRPTFKLVLAGNHKPSVWDTSEGFWRRVRVLPFAFTVPPERRVKDYHTLLLAEEGPGILRWALEGCRAWARDGLGEPTAVTLETAAYRHDEDVLGDFIDAALREQKGSRVAHPDLRRCYEQFCQRADVTLLGSKAFISRLHERGHVDVRSNGKRWWKDLALVPQEQPVPQDHDDDAPPF